MHCSLSRRAESAPQSCRYLFKRETPAQPHPPARSGEEWNRNSALTLPCPGRAADSVSLPCPALSRSVPKPGGTAAIQGHGCCHIVVSSWEVTPARLCGLLSLLGVEVTRGDPREWHFPAP